MKTPDLEYVSANIYKMVPRVLRTHWPEFYEHLNSRWPGLRTSEQLYRFFNGEPNVCPCGKPTKYINFSQGYTTYCSCKCAANHNQKVREQTCLERYGVKNALCTPESKQNARLKTKQASKTRIRTCLERYGVEYVSQIPQAKEKYKQTCLERYGTTNTFQAEEIKSKIRQTCLERYGVENPSKSPHIAAKAAQKSSQKQRLNFIKTHDFLIDYTDSGEWICKCPHPGCTECPEKQYIISALHYGLRSSNGTEPCTKLLPIGKTQTSGLEIFIKKILDAHNIKYVKDRTILGGQELDFYLPDYEIAIECNGVYWHSSDRHNKEYHYNKFTLCESKGIQLLSFWQDWIINKPEIVESMILNKLGLTPTRIFARKCKIIELRSASKFLNHNHIQGSCNASIKLGLVYQNEIVAVMCFNKRSKLSGGKNDDSWELVRFCNKLNTIVVGGAGRLLKYFISRIKPAKIVSFSSNDISTGTLYKRLGFEKKQTSIPYWYIEPTTYLRYHRSAFTRRSISNRWPEYDINDKSWTEQSVMYAKHYNKIYDSGMVRWELIIRESK